MSSFLSVAPCFLVSDVGQTIHWYEENLGFMSFPFPKQEPHVFAIMQRENVEIMLQRLPGYQKPELHSRRDGGVWDAYIRVKGVAEFYEQVRKRVEVLLTLRQQPYGDWEFEIRDPNGYVLVFSEWIETDPANPDKFCD